MTEKIVKKLSDVDGEIKRWKKRPVEIRAVQLKEKVAIKTREGTLYGEKGDFLIEGIKGEIYPCGKSIFFQTYDVVNPDAKEEIIMAQIVKKDGNLTMKHSKSAGQFEIFGFLSCYIQAIEMDMINSFEGDDNFELF